MASGLVAGCSLQDLVIHRRVDKLPPARLRFNVGTPGARRFLDSGERLLPLYAQLCGLTSESHVLDVGCGCGRVARPLSAFLTAAGSYDGFDVNDAAISYCVDAYRGLTNFRFLRVDMRTARYNPGGRLSSQEFRFPYPDNAFDFVNLTSVMTHLLPDDVRAYLSELQRVLTPSGKAWVTFFLLSDKAREAASTSPGRFRFPYPCGAHRIEILADPEAGICHDESFVWESYRLANLRADRVFRGSWLGDPPDISTPFANMQDVVITSRAA